MPFKLSVESEREVSRKLQKLAQSLPTKELMKMLRKGAKPMVRHMKDNVPVYNGVLKDGIGTKPNKQLTTKGNATLAVGAVIRFGGLFPHHAHLVEFGTVHSRAIPFLRPAFDEKSTTARIIIIQELAKKANKALK